MSLDTYSRCSYDCLYCFSYFQRAVSNFGKNYLHGKVSAVSVKNIKRKFLDPPRSWCFSEYVKQRLVMQWGGLSDPFDEYERRFGKSLQLLRFFKMIRYPITFSTKGVWFTEDERYLSQFRDAANFHVKMSIITMDENKAGIVERGVPTPKDRLQALYRLNKAGVGETVLRLRPFIIGLTDFTYIDLIRRAADVGVSAISTEFFCLEARANGPLLDRYSKLGAVCGGNVYEFYRKHSGKGQGSYKRLNRKIKEPFVDVMEEECGKLGIGFYVSDAHFKERSCGGSCCGIPESWTYTRAQFTEALQVAKRVGEVRFCDVYSVENVSHIDDVTLMKATGMQKKNIVYTAKYGDFTLLELARYSWNEPNRQSSPYKYFGGVLKPDRIDENGDVVYIYCLGDESENPTGA